MWNNEQIVKHAKDAANPSKKMRKRFFELNLDSRMREPSTFEKTLGFFQWRKKNAFTTEQTELYMKTYREHYVP